MARIGDLLQLRLEPHQRYGGFTRRIQHQPVHYRLRQISLGRTSTRAVFGNKPIGRPRLPQHHIGEALNNHWSLPRRILEPVHQVTVRFHHAIGAAPLGSLFVVF